MIRRKRLRVSDAHGTCTHRCKSRIPSQKFPRNFWRAGHQICRDTKGNQNENHEHSGCDSQLIFSAVSRLKSGSARLQRKTVLVKAKQPDEQNGLKILAAKKRLTAVKRPDDPKRLAGLFSRQWNAKTVFKRIKDKGITTIHNAAGTRRLTKNETTNAFVSKARYLPKFFFLS